MPRCHICDVSTFIQLLWTIWTSPWTIWISPWTIQKSMHLIGQKVSLLSHVKKWRQLMISVRNAKVEIQQQQHQRFLVGDILTWGCFDCTLSKSSPPLLKGRLSDRPARNGEDMIRISADDLIHYKLLTPEKTESLLEEVEGHTMFPIYLPLEDGRTDGTVSDDTSILIVHKSERFMPVSSEDCDHFLPANVNKTLSTKLTVISICSTYGQDKTSR